jgi:hypothetical protein
MEHQQQLVVKIGQQNSYANWSHIQGTLSCDEPFRLVYSNWRRGRDSQILECVRYFSLQEA